MNLSTEVVETIMNSLRASKEDLKRQMKKASGNKEQIIKHQLGDVEYAIECIEEGGWY